MFEHKRWERTGREGAGREGVRMGRAWTGGEGGGARAVETFNDPWPETAETDETRGRGPWALRYPLAETNNKEVHMYI